MQKKMKSLKNAYLQVRVSPEEAERIERAAKELSKKRGKRVSKSDIVREGIEQVCNALI